MHFSGRARVMLCPVIDYMIIGPYTGKEIFDSLNLKYSSMTNEQKMFNLEVICNAFIEHGYGVSIMLPEANSRSLEETLIAPAGKQFDGFTRWDSFCAFFGITTRHAQMLKDYPFQLLYAQKRIKERHLETEELSRTAPASFTEKSDKILQRAEKRIMENDILLDTRTERATEMLGMFYEKSDFDKFKRQHGKNIVDSSISLAGGKKISAISYTAARIFALTGKDISKDDHGVDPEIFKSVSREYFNLYQNPDKLDQDQLTAIVKNNLTPDSKLIEAAGGTLLFNPDAEINENSPVRQIAEIAPFIHVKQQVNQLFDGGNSAYSQDIEKTEKLSARFTRAHKEKLLAGAIRAENVDNALFQCNNFIKTEITNNTKNQIKAFESSTNRNVPVTATTEALKKTFDRFDKLTGRYTTKADKLEVMANAILSGDEVKVFGSKINMSYEDVLQDINPVKDADLPAESVVDGRYKKVNTLSVSYSYENVHTKNYETYETISEEEEELDESEELNSSSV